MAAYMRVCLRMTSLMAKERLPLDLKQVHLEIHILVNLRMAGSMERVFTPTQVENNLLEDSRMESDMVRAPLLSWMAL